MITCKTEIIEVVDKSFLIRHDVYYFLGLKVYSHYWERENDTIAGQEVYKMDVARRRIKERPA